MKPQRPHDIQIRLPKSKKYIKARLQKIAERNGLTLNQVVTLALETFLGFDEFKPIIKIK